MIINPVTTSLPPRIFNDPMADRLYMGADSVLPQIIKTTALLALPQQGKVVEQ
jgi:hypothetical protein